MHKEVPETSCADCGTPLGGEYALKPDAERPPCPNCGSTTRHFNVKATARILEPSVAQALEQIEEAEPGDVQQIASAQTRLLVSYYDTALAQAQRSFTLACIAAVVGLVFFL